MEKNPTETGKKWKYGGIAVFSFFLIKGLVWLAILLGLGELMCNAG